VAKKTAKASRKIVSADESGGKWRAGGGISRNNERKASKIRRPAGGISGNIGISISMVWRHHGQWQK